MWHPLQTAALFRLGSLPPRSRGFRSVPLGALTIAVLAGCVDDSPVAPEPITCASLPDIFGDPGQAVALSASSAEQLVEEGIPQRRSALTLSFDGAVQLCDAGGITLETAVRDPVDDQVKLQLLNVLEVRAQGSGLTLEVEGPVSEGARVSFPQAALIAGDVALGAGTVSLAGAQFTSPSEAALWIKAVEPTDPDLFSASVYGGSRSVDLPLPSEAEVRQDLQAHLERVQAAGRITAGRADELRAMFENAAVRENFTDSSGIFYPQLLGGVLVTAGTVGESTIDGVIDGVNETGEPARVGAEDMPPNVIAGVSITDGRMVITVNVRTLNQPLSTLAPILVHELMHQDLDTSQNEEVAARVAEIATYAQHLLLEPAAAATGAALTRFYNVQLLMLLNSGRVAYPRAGHREAPLGQDPPDVVPGSGVLDFVSLESHLRNGTYRAVANVDTPGNTHLNRVATAISGREQSGLAFDDAALALFDDLRVFTPEEQFQLLRILKLRFAEESAAAVGSRVWR